MSIEIAKEDDQCSKRTGTAPEKNIIDMNDMIDVFADRKTEMMEIWRRA